MHILVIDSGVGGLSIIDCLRAKGRYDITFVMDHAFWPYGNKPANLVISRTIAIVQNVLTETKVDMVVVACNTASTQALQQLRDEFHIPFVGVVPAIKPAALDSKSGHIALLATEATCKGAYVDWLEKEFAQDCQVHRIASNTLVELAEAYICGDLNEQQSMLLEKEAASISATHPLIDTVVLGCTHFPLLRTKLQSLCPGLHIVDSGKAIANRVEHIRVEKMVSEGQGRLDVVSTGTLSAKQKRAIEARFDINEIRKFDD